MARRNTDFDSLPHVVHDWTTLKEGREVEVHLFETVIDRGRVDVVMPDGSMLWLTHDASPRRIIEKLPDLVIKSDLWT